MLAYYVHDDKKAQDYLIIPEIDLTIPVDRHIMTDFISVRPAFSQRTGVALNSLKPDAFGRIVATRDDQGDVCVVDIALWQKRMAVHLESI